MQKSVNYYNNTDERVPSLLVKLPPRRCLSVTASPYMLSNEQVTTILNKVFLPTGIPSSQPKEIFPLSIPNTFVKCKRDTFACDFSNVGTTDTYITASHILHNVIDCHQATDSLLFTVALSDDCPTLEDLHIKQVKVVLGRSCARMTLAIMAHVVQCFFNWPVAARKQLYKTVSEHLCGRPSFGDCDGLWPENRKNKTHITNFYHFCQYYFREYLNDISCGYFEITEEMVDGLFLVLMIINE